MFSNKLSKESCFLCFCKPNAGNTLKNAQKISCPGSKKLLKDVIQYLANSAKFELKLTKETLLCLECCRKIISFDENMMKVMKQKRELLNRIEEAMTHLESDFEEELEIAYKVEENKISDAVSSDAELSDTSEKAPTDIYEAYREQTKQTWSKISSYRCHVCEIRLPNKKEHDKHMNEEHKIFKCDVCKFAHYNENQVILHKNVHKGLKETQCPVCHKQFTKKMSTIRHMESHTNLPKYQCDKCGLRFSQSTVFNNHKMRHDAEENPLFCKICKQQFKTIKTFRRHGITHRKDRPRYACEYCPKTFGEKYTLKKHYSIHIQDDEYKADKQKTAQRTNKFHCIICDQIFINTELLDKHMEKDHDVIT